jgi:hypothetical protein
MTNGDFEVLGFFPADHAVAVDGKVYVNGGFWNMLRFPSFPHVAPAFSLVAVLKVPYRAYHQDHKMTLLLEDADGKPLGLRVDGEFRVGTEPHMRVGDPTVMPLAVQVNNLTIETPGDVVMKLEVDGTELARYGVRVVQVVGAALSPGGGPPTASENRPEKPPETS